VKRGLHVSRVVCVSDEAAESFRMPLPMVTILASGKNVAGKLRCVKEFMVVPAPGMPLVDVCSVSLCSCIQHIPFESTLCSKIHWNWNNSLLDFLLIMIMIMTVLLLPLKLQHYGRIEMFIVAVVLLLLNK